MIAQRKKESFANVLHSNKIFKSCVTLKYSKHELISKHHQEISPLYFLRFSQEIHTISIVFATLR